MPRTVVEDEQRGFTGLNTTADPVHIGPTEVTEATNAQVTLFGGVTPRLGSKRIHATALAGSVQGMFIWDANPSDFMQLCVVAGGTFYTAPMVGSPPYVFTAHGSITGNAQVAQMCAFTDATPTNVIYIANGLTLYKWNGTSLTAVSGPPNIGSICVANQRLIAVSNASAIGNNPYGFFWSSLNSGDDVGVPSIPGAGGSAVIVPGAQSYCTGVLPYGQGAIIGQRNGLATFQGYGQNDMSIQSGTSGLSGDTGSPSPVGMCAVENFAIVASDRGCYVVTPFGFLQQISKPVESLWSATMFQGPFPFLTEFAVHDRIGHQVFISMNGTYVSGSGGFATNPGVLVYNYRTEGWYGPWVYNWGGARVTCATTGQNFLNTGPYVFFGGSDGFIRQVQVPGIGFDDVQSDGTGGNPYTMRVTSRPLFGVDQTGQPMYDQEKAWRWVDVQAQLVNPGSSQITVETWPEESVANTFSNLAPAYNYQSDTAPRTYRTQVGGRGQALTVTITDTPTNNPAGQNVYTGVRAVGRGYGRRF